MPAVRGSPSIAYSFGPGPPTRAVKQLLIATIGVFVAQMVWTLFMPADLKRYTGVSILQPVVPFLVDWLALTPQAVLEQLRVWQPLTYMFLHAGPSHLIFNMLALWMFGVDLERRWGRLAFLRYWFVCGIGAGLTCILAGLLPWFSDPIYVTPTVGASGGVYGLMLAYAILFPDRTIYYFIFPIPVRIYVLIAGALVMLQSYSNSGGVAHFAHLGGLVFGYLYLSMGRGGPWAEIKYRWVRWRMNRMKKKFGVHEGGRRWDSRIH
jgi:membrane associated rhomboid family serine protease